MPCHSLLSCYCLKSPVALCCGADINRDIIVLLVSLCGLFESPPEGWACKVAELHDARASLWVVVLRFSTNDDYGYVLN